ncbi:MAG: mannose-1-phosphate guanylyltransferase/mannose-6-phosphate isomerase [Magnetococcales bacterium]|nr:mannose-1-phosphate guanylyltransferase/mannose-6-phosphate isomerase [Magnetococcales bacterium]
MIHFAWSAQSLDRSDLLEAPLKLIPVLLSGGSGTRLWPLSRASHPKQFIPLVDNGTLFQASIRRLSGIPETTLPILVCNQQHRFLAAEQMRKVDSEAMGILLEPMGRNTAPAVACAALFALQEEEQALLLVMPADHLMSHPEGFHGAIAAGRPEAEAGRLVTFGITPDRPETGFGYIRHGAALGSGAALKVDAFVEKPDLATAEGYLADGGYSWNSGVFLFRADTYLEELQRFHPEMVSACRESVEQAARDLDFVRLDPTAFAACPSDSIDYAVMERTDSAAVVPMEAGWSDVGAWSALWDVTEKDDQGNVVSGDVALADAHDCYLRSESRLLAAVGLEKHIVVETADAVFVAPLDRSQDVKKVVTQLRKAGRGEALAHRRVYRPWGSYESLQTSERFQVKRIIVNPGAILSLQLHHHRAEHWVIVKGTASITKGDETFLLSEDQSTYIPLGVKHRLENNGKIPLELIEVQTGSYLGEDDIVRFEDRYGRMEKPEEG